jgi:hypothetical protein
MNSLNLKDTSLLNSSFEWIVRLILRILFECESFDSVIWDEDVVACSHSRRKDIVKITIVIHDCECLLSCEKSCVFHARNHASFMREMLVSRITHREDDHFDRFKIQIEFFVWFFLKFIESDRLSWIKNVVNCKWWMRKWIVKKTKMRCRRIFRLKKRFLFLRFWSNFSFAFVILSVDFFCLFKKIFFEAFVMSSVWNSLSTDLNIIKFDRSLSKFLKIVLEKNSRSKCCQRCIKFLIENSSLKCVFDVSRVICNRCERLNAVCMIVWMSSICRWRVDD